MHAGCTGVDAHSAPVGIAFHPQDVAVAADEQVRTFGDKPVAHARCIPSGMAADVEHRATQSAAFPEQPFWAGAAHAVVVDVAKYSPHRCDFGECIEDLEAPDVARMPNLRAAFEVVQNAVVEVAVGVGKDADAHVGEFGPIFGPQTSVMRTFLLAFALLLPEMFWAQPGRPSLGASSDRRAAKLFEEAVASYAAQDFIGAETACTEAIARDPKFFDGWMLRAQLREDAARWGEAYSDATSACAARPDLVGNWHRSYLVRLAFRSGEYSAAASALAELGAWNPPAEGDRPAWELLKRSVAFADSAVRAHGPTEAIPLPGDVNTPAPEYYPALVLDGNRMLFTREVQSNRGRQEDFFWAEKQSGKWVVTGPAAGVNTSSGNEGAPTLRGDGRLLVFTACEQPGYGYGPREGLGSCDLFEARWLPEQGRFGPAENVGLPNSRAWESQPSLSADGSTLLYVRSARDGEGRRWQDVFIARRGPSGRFEAGVPLPGPVNTSGNEENPMLHPDGTSLYFASDGHPGFGGMDLFVSRLQPNGTWGNPVNLGYPINTAADENSLLVAPDGRVAYFATDRALPGNLDLWMLDLPEEVAAVPQRALTGRVFDAATRKPLSAEVELRREDGSFHARVASDPVDGSFALPLPEVGSLQFLVDLPGFTFFTAVVAAAEFIEKSVEIPLQRWKVGTMLTLRDVRFATNSAELLSTQQAELDQLVALLAPGNERIRITGHTDATGNAAFNLDLSARRAAAVRDYLIARGIDGARLVAEGKGAAEPIATNETPEGRALNRRTDITVIE